MTYYVQHDEWVDETTPAQWAKIRKLADAGDENGLIEYLFEIGTIDPRSSPVFVLGKSEHKRCAKIYYDGESAERQANELQEYLDVLNRTTNLDPETFLTRKRELTAKIVELREKASWTYLAGQNCQSLMQHFPRLFDLSPVGNPPHWPPAVSVLSIPMSDLLRKLGLPQGVVDPHRFFAPVAMPSKPVRRIVSPLIGSAE